MPTWTVQSTSLAPLDAQPGLTGITQFQTSNPGEVVPGTFVTQIWTSDHATQIVQDPDHGLPPESGSTSMQFSSSVMPSGQVALFTFYTDPADPGQRLSEQWHPPIDEPSTGWSQQDFEVHWVPNG